MRHRLADFGPRRLYSLLQESEVEENRETLCPVYSKCVDIASDLRWTSFTCRYCPLFKKLRKEAQNYVDGIARINSKSR